MENENLIHIKLEYLEAIESRKDILNIEKKLLIIKRIMNNYGSLRTNELNLKLKLHRKIKYLLNNLDSVGETFPKVPSEKTIKNPELIKEVKIPKINTKIQKKPLTDIDVELSDIQAKLRSLGSG